MIRHQGWPRAAAPALLAALLLAAPAMAGSLSKHVRKVAEAGSEGGGCWAVVVRPLDEEAGHGNSFEQDSRRRLLGASTCKLFTCYAAASVLPPDTSLATLLVARGRLEGRTWIGSLRVYGGGAPGILSWESLQGAAAPETGALVLERLARLARSSGIDTLAGEIVAEEMSFFPGDSLGPGWEWDDLAWYYGTKVTSLAVDDNALEVRFEEGPGGIEAHTRALPPGWRVECRLMEQGPGPPDIQSRWIGPTTLELTGRLARGDAGHLERPAIARPDLYARDRFREALGRAGIAVVAPRGAGAASDSQWTLGAVSSPALAQVYHPILARSQNLRAEQLLRVLGMARIAEGTAAAGLEVVRRALAGLGLGEADVWLLDGCGLSRHDLVTADALARVLADASRRADAGDAGMHDMLAGLALPGEEGTFRSRFTGEKWPGAPGWIRGKTGSMDGVDAFAAIVAGEEGRRFVVVSIRNHFPETRSEAHAWEDRLVRSVAGLE